MGVNQPSTSPSHQALLLYSRIWRSRQGNADPRARGKGMILLEALGHLLLCSEWELQGFTNTENSLINSNSNSRNKRVKIRNWWLLWPFCFAQCQLPSFFTDNAFPTERKPSQVTLLAHCTFKKCIWPHEDASKFWCLAEKKNICTQFIYRAAHKILPLRAFPRKRLEIKI